MSIFNRKTAVAGRAFTLTLASGTYGVVGYNLTAADAPLAPGGNFSNVTIGVWSIANYNQSYSGCIGIYGSAGRQFDLGWWNPSVDRELRLVTSLGPGQSFAIQPAYSSQVSEIPNWIFTVIRTQETGGGVGYPVEAYYSALGSETWHKVSVDTSSEPTVATESYTFHFVTTGSFNWPLSMCHARVFNKRLSFEEFRKLKTQFRPRGDEYAYYPLDAVTANTSQLIDISGNHRHMGWETDGAVTLSYRQGPRGLVQADPKIYYLGPFGTNYLYDKIDETVSDRTDYISANVVGEYYEFDMTPITRPLAGSNIIVNYDMGFIGSNIANLNLKIEIFDPRVAPL